MQNNNRPVLKSLHGLSLKDERGQAAAETRAYDSDTAQPGQFQYQTFVDTEDMGATSKRLLANKGSLNHSVRAPPRNARLYDSPLALPRHVWVK